MHLGECLGVLRDCNPDNHVDAVVTDRRLAAERVFIDRMTAIFAECLRVLKPGGLAVVWALPRTIHWTGMASDLTGFEIENCIYHVFGQGIPKGPNITLQFEKRPCQHVNRDWRYSALDAKTYCLHRELAGGVEAALLYSVQVPGLLAGHSLTAIFSSASPSRRTLATLPSSIASAASSRLTFALDDFLSDLAVRSISSALIGSGAADAVLLQQMLGNTGTCWAICQR